MFSLGAWCFFVGIGFWVFAREAPKTLNNKKTFVHSCWCHKSARCTFGEGVLRKRRVLDVGYSQGPSNSNHPLHCRL